MDARGTDGEGVFPVANTTSNATADVVFVHGLGGSSHTTWRHGKADAPDSFFWPYELGSDLSDVAVWTVGYPAGITTLGDPGMKISLRAGNLAHGLAAKGVGKRPVVFVAHSMGGLIVKSLIVDSQTLPGKDRKQLVSAIAGVVFCATPHRGSAYASSAKVLGSFVGTQTHVGEMVDKSTDLDLLHDKFLEWHRNHPIHVLSFAEGHELMKRRRILRPLPLGFVVDRTSANSSIGELRDIDDDHLSIVKPRSRDHGVYAGVLRWLQEEVLLNRADYEGAPLSSSHGGGSGNLDSAIVDAHDVIAVLGQQVASKDSTPDSTRVDDSSTEHRDADLVFDAPLKPTEISLRMVVAEQRIDSRDRVRVQWSTDSELVLENIEAAWAAAKQHSEWWTHAPANEVAEWMRDLRDPAPERTRRAHTERASAEIRMARMLDGMEPYFSDDDRYDALAAFSRLCDFQIHYMAAYYLSHTRIRTALLSVTWSDWIDQITSSDLSSTDVILELSPPIWRARVSRFSNVDLVDVDLDGPPWIYINLPEETARRMMDNEAPRDEWHRFIIPQVESRLLGKDVRFHWDETMTVERMHDPDGKELWGPWRVE